MLALIFSRAANRSDAVLNELELAFNRGKPILPIRIEAVEPSGSAEYYLRRRQWFDIDVDFAQRLGALPAIVREAVGAVRRPRRIRRMASAFEEEPDDAGLLAARDVERRSIGALLEHARAGKGGLVIVTGEPGIGKTRLLRAALQDARGAGFQSAFVTNFAHTRTPLGPWTDVLRQLDPHAHELLPSDIAERSALLRLVGEAEPGTAAPDGRRLLVIVADALARASKRRPLFVAVDDAQWCDPESVELLDVLAPRLAAAHLAILVGRRSGESNETASALSGLERYPAVAEIRLDRLPDAAIAQLVAALAPPAGVIAGATIEEICRRSEGNPLFAAELVREAAGGNELLPESVQLSATHRLGTLPNESAHVIEVAAVIGRAFGLDDLIAVAAVERPQALAALRAARDAGLVRDAGAATFAFRHELLRAAVYENMFSAERAEVHRALAELLVARADAPAELLAHHWRRAGDLARATHYAVLAGDEAMALNAYASARDNYAEALDTGVLEGLDAASVEEKAASAYDALGSADDAARDFAAAAELVRASGDAQRAARLDLRFAANAYRAGRGSEVERICDRVLRESTDAQVLYGAHAILASYYSTRAAPERVRSHVAAAAALDVEGNVRDALSIAWARTSIADPPDGWLAPAREAVALAESRATPALHALNLVNFAMLSRWYGRSGDERDTAIARAVELADRNGATYTAAYARCEQALGLHLRGELDAAYRVLLEAVALHVEAVVVRIFVASVGLSLLADLGAVDRFPNFRDPTLLEAAFTTGEPGRFAALAAAHVQASALSGALGAAAPIVKRALALIATFAGVSRSLVTFARYGDDDDRAQIVTLLPSAGAQLPDELDRLLIAAIVSSHTGEASTKDAARRALDAARAADAPLFEAVAYELLGQFDDARSVYERTGALGRMRAIASHVQHRRRSRSANAG